MSLSLYEVVIPPFQQILTAVAASLAFVGHVLFQRRDLDAP